MQFGWSLLMFQRSVLSVSLKSNCKQSKQAIARVTETSVGPHDFTSQKLVLCRHCSENLKLRSYIRFALNLLWNSLLQAFISDSVLSYIQTVMAASTFLTETMLKAFYISQNHLIVLNRSFGKSLLDSLSVSNSYYCFNTIVIKVNIACVIIL